MKAEVTPLRTAAETQLVERFRSVRDRLPGGAEVSRRREQALDVFLRSGLPTRRNEAWHYTDLRAAMREAAPLALPPDRRASAAAKALLQTLDDIEATRLVAVDGFFVPELSDLDALPEGVSVASLADALAQEQAKVMRLFGLDHAGEDAIFALNTALAQDGVVVEIAAGAMLEKPLCVLSVRTGAAFSATRSLVLAGPRSSAVVLEIQASVAGGSSQMDDALQFALGEGARVEHVVIQSDALDALSLANVTADLDEGSVFNSFALVSGAGLSRRQLFVRCLGARARTKLSGVTLIAGDQHADTTLVVDHAAPHGESRERFKHIIDGEGTGVFQGKVIVRPGAQKTDGGMKSDALLLSESASMNNKPELEIFADDVVCGHGATSGALDEGQLFYLMARGLPRPEAEALLLEAFAGQAVDLVEHEGLRTMLRNRVRGWLAARGRGGTQAPPADASRQRSLS
jgi:Fe-S cluster assembly protein SufD